MLIYMTMEQRVNDIDKWKVLEKIWKISTLIISEAPRHCNESDTNAVIFFKCIEILNFIIFA